MFPLVKAKIDRLTLAWEKSNRTFIGIDVSSSVTGLTAVRFDRSLVSCVYSVVVELKNSKSQSSDCAVLHERFDKLKRALISLRESQKQVEGNWEVSVEDKIVRAGGKKGVIGSHTLAEMIAAARIAAHDVFPEAIPSKINPRSARAGLGLNAIGEASGREETKENVVELVKSTAPGFVLTGKKADQDRADAFIIALSGIRSAIKRDLLSDVDICQQFVKCHGHIDFGSTKKSRNEKLLFEELESRFSPWVDDIWLQKQFPKRVL